MGKENVCVHCGAELNAAGKAKSSKKEKYYGKEKKKAKYYGKEKKARKKK